MNRRKLQNPPKINLHGKCHSTAPRRATHIPKCVILKVMGKSIFSYKTHFLLKYLVVALDEVEVETQVSSHLLSVRTQKAPVQIQNGHYHLVRLGI